MNLKNKLFAELIGTFWLVFGGCGSAVLAAKFLATEGVTPINLGIGLVGVSLAFGLTVLTMAYAIGLGLTLIHLIGIPVTNLSVNPARSTGPALFVGGWALQQLWLFWVAPVVGAALAGMVYPLVAGRESRGG
jgi:glycerol uptake facilitator-like aquaporin